MLRPELPLLVSPTEKLLVFFSGLLNQLGSEITKPLADKLIQRPVKPQIPSRLTVLLFGQPGIALNQPESFPHHRCGIPTQSRLMPVPCRNTHTDTERPERHPLPNHLAANRLFRNPRMPKVMVILTRIRMLAAELNSPPVDQLEQADFLAADVIKSHFDHRPRNGPPENLLERSGMIRPQIDREPRKVTLHPPPLVPPAQGLPVLDLSPVVTFIPLPALLLMIPIQIPPAGQHLLHPRITRHLLLTGPTDRPIPAGTDSRDVRAERLYHHPIRNFNRNILNPARVLLAQVLPCHIILVPFARHNPMRHRHR